MGQGLEVCRADAPAHVEFIDEIKDQLLIVLMKRCAGISGTLTIPADEFSDVSQDLLEFHTTEDGALHFVVKKKS